MGVARAEGAGSLASMRPSPRAQPEHALGRRGLPRGALSVLLLLVGLLLRVPSLTLPLGPVDAALAVAGEDLAAEHAADLQGHGPLLPVLLMVTTASGLPAGLTLRVLTLLVGALLPLLAHRLALRLGFTARAAALAALLLALHPVLVAHAGGPEAGAAGPALACLLLGLLRLARGAGGTQRGALVLLALAPLLHPAAWPFLVPLSILCLAAEPGGRGRALLGALAAGAFAAGLLRGPGAGGGPAAALLVGLPAAGLLLLLPFAGPGLLRLLPEAHAQRPLWTAWLGGAALHLLLLAAGVLRPGVRAAWDGLGPVLLLAPPLVLLGVQGLATLGRAWRLRVEAGTLLLSLAAALLLGLAPAQARLLPEDSADAGRLHSLREALRMAAREAGASGWVALDLGEGTAVEARAARPWLAGRSLLITPASGGPSAPPAGWSEGGPRTLALVTRAPEPGGTTTLGGLGIFLQERAGSSGPYTVLRVRRP